MQLLTIGVMGEYISRIHDEVRGRPLYLVRETQGFGTPPLASPERPLEAMLAIEDQPSENAPSVPPR